MIDKRSDFKKNLFDQKQKLSNIKKNRLIDKNQNALSFGLKIATDFIVTIIVGCLIGLGVDKLFQTKPIFFLIFLLLGIAGAFLNIYRTVLKLNK
tara:strand:- start:313 stop:597 length:285 start_codon:yes stop_codon:yes gene_type:complete